MKFDKQEVSKLIRDILGEDRPADMISNWLSDKGYDIPPTSEEPDAFDKLWEVIDEILKVNKK